MLAFRLARKIPLASKEVINSVSRVRPSRSLAIVRDDKIPTGNSRIAMANGANPFNVRFSYAMYRPLPESKPEHSKNAIARKHKMLIICCFRILVEEVSFQKTGESVTGNRSVGQPIPEAESWAVKTSLYPISLPVAFKP